MSHNCVLLTETIGIMINRIVFISIVLSFALNISTKGFAQSLTITPSIENNQYQTGETIGIQIQLDSYISGNPSFLHSWIDATGYRKLKLGNNPDNYYNPPLDVIASGNTHIEITMRVRDLQTSWKKMLFRPNGVANSVRMNSYVPENIQVNQWFTFSIPIEDFDGVTDFTQLKNIEFPYSGGANHYDWDIYSIIFTGSQSPVVWMGPGQINNANNGNGGSGEVYAEWTISSQTDQEIPVIKVFANGSPLGEAAGLSAGFSYVPSQAGMINLLAEAWAAGEIIASASMQIEVSDPVAEDISISLQNPTDNQTFNYQELIQVSTSVTGNLSTEEAYLKVNGIESGWRKLKIGNNSNSLYGPALDIIQSGQTHLVMIIKDIDNSVNWKKIEVRPNGVSTNAIGMEFYWNQKEDLGDGWSKITIPLYAFDSSINFGALANIEFPYSKGAGVFEMHIREISFTGGSQDHVWFGGTQTDNLHDGFGNPGQLLAELIEPDNGGYNLIRADLVLNDQVYASDFTMPFSWDLNNLQSGQYQISITLNLDNQQYTSSLVNINILPPVFNIPVISLDPLYPFGYIPTGKSFQVSGTISNLGEGESVQTQLWINGSLMQSSDNTNFDFDAAFPISGHSDWYVKAVSSSGAETVSGPYEIEVLNPGENPRASIASPTQNQSLIQNSVIKIQGAYTPEDTGELPYLEITNPGSGYRKLKIGNNPDNLYSPRIDVIQSGNTQLDITMKLMDGQPDFSKLVVCPQEITTNAPQLASYWNDAADLGDGWKKISIPLADFDASIDFSSLGYIAFPYSRDAGYFKFGVREITFTGGSNPYLFLGESKLDNLHDGYGNPGQLSVSVIMANQPAEPENYIFFVDDQYLGEVSNPALSIDYTASSIGAHIVDLFCFMEDGLTFLGVPTSFNIIEPLPESDQIVLRLSFDQNETISVEQARLRYNKSFAYSLTLDDGLDDAYSHAFSILNGGYIEGNGKSYSGLFFTDGCGNDIPFTAGMSWFSVSSAYNDLHVNTPSYVTWNQLIEMYNAGWDVLNHSYSHSTATDTDFYWEIEQNQSYVYEQTGILMNQFVISGGGDYVPYQQAALDYGMKAIYAYKSDFEGYPKGIQTDAERSWENMSIYRGYKYDSYYTIANIMNTIDGIAANSSESNHVWYNDFTHRVQFGDKGGSLLVETFEYYMSEIESRYGKKGSDEVWMASVQQVWEYLYVRDHTNIITNWEGSDLLVTIDISQIPSDLRTKALSLVVSGNNGNFTVVAETPDVSLSSNPGSGLINLQWDIEEAKVLKTQFDQTLFNESNELECYPIPAVDYITIQTEGFEDHATLQIFDIAGKIVYQTTINQQFVTTLNCADSNLESGVYFITVSDQSKQLSRKILVK